MSSYRDETYGDTIAETYDAWYGGFDENAIDFLAEMARGGRALELGIGTGRIALPLQERGIKVHGVDASEAMVEKLHAKPGGDRIPVTLGSFADFAVEGEFSLIYVVFNTFFALLTQDEQVQCFESVARHLAKNGAFVMEAFVPDMGRFDRGQTVRVNALDLGEARIDASTIDRANQQIMSQHIVLTEKGIRLYPVKLRYAWPSELDLMARLAGLRLADRWEDWNRTPYSGGSGMHISVYRKG